MNDLLHIVTALAFGVGAGLLLVSVIMATSCSARKQTRMDK